LRRLTLNKRKQTKAVEECWTLVGARRGRIWHLRRIDRCAGAITSVQFGGLAALHREERRRDVMGFLHTHPDGPPHPSARDIRTMRAWCSAFGKPLLCAIASPLGLAAFQFIDDSSDGIPMLAVEIFPRGVVIGVERDGRKVPA
jgi:Prokaryotic homologs of the JAB domain